MHGFAEYVRFILLCDIACTGMFYYLLGNIAPNLRSTLKGIQLIACVTTEKLEKYGFEMVLAPFIKDANALSNVSKCVVRLLRVHSACRIIIHAGRFITGHCHDNQRCAKDCERCSSVCTDQYLGCTQQGRF